MIINCKFDEARKILLDRYDDAVIALRKIISDPQWDNADHREYRKAVESLESTVDKIRRLNTCNMEVE